ncbi:MAG: regulator [Desulfuromonadales bacterium C00003094]|jgi:two-component system chemotaxis response regulator CheY|nr:MAG: regulator [Desulfuromonadales bacterium C00003094]
MLVDDSKFMRALLKKVLASAHNIVGEAENGVEAIDMYEQLSPDIVLMDIVMPHMDGILATSNIVGKHPDAKVIMCTSVGQDEKVKAAIKAGAKGYITKPFQGPSVLKEVESLLGQ